MGKRKIAGLVSTTIFMGTLTSCQCSREQSLTPEDHSWINAYEKGDTVWFRSNLGTVDTLIVTGKGIYDGGPVLAGTATPDSARVGIGYYDFMIRESGGYITGNLHLQRNHNGRDAEVFSALKLRMSFTSLSEAEELSTANEILPGGISIDGDYMLFDDRNSEYSEHHASMKGKVVSYVISKDHGLEYYKFDDGEEFTRIPD